MNPMQSDSTHDDELNDDLEDAFKASLRHGLSQLAQKAPAGPTAEQVISSLHQRQSARRRFAWVTSSLAAAAALLVVTLVRLGAQHDSQNPSPTAPPRTTGDASNAPAMALTNDADRRISDDAKKSPAPEDHPTRPPAGWNLAPIASSIDLTNQHEKTSDASDGDSSWNISLSLTLASAVDSELLLPVMELSSPRW